MIEPNTQKEYKTSLTSHKNNRVEGLCLEDILPINEAFQMSFENPLLESVTRQALCDDELGEEKENFIMQSDMSFFGAQQTPQENWDDCTPIAKVELVKEEDFTLCSENKGAISEKSLEEEVSRVPFKVIQAQELQI
jgi:hypothetical protein